MLQQEVQSLFLHPMCRIEEVGKESGAKGMCQLPFKAVSKMLAHSTPTPMSLAGTSLHGCTSHRASDRVSLYSRVPGTHVKSRVSITEKEGKSGPG